MYCRNQNWENRSASAIIVKKPPRTDMLATLPLFSVLAEDHLERISSRVRERHLDRNCILFRKGDKPHSLYAILEGQVKIVLPSANGHEKVIELIGARQTFGEHALITDSPYLVFSQAVATTRLLQVPADVIQDLLINAPDFVRHLLASLAERTQRLIEEVGSFSQQTGTQRFVRYLRQHMESGAATDGSITISLPAPKQIIASCLNLTPETLSRILAELSAAGLISVSGKQITLHNLRRLREYD